MRHLAYLAAVVLAVAGLIVLLTGGSAAIALGLIIISVMITLWQREMDRRR